MGLLFQIVFLTSLFLIGHTTHEQPECANGFEHLADIVFVVDSSGSINEQDPLNWERVKNFTIDIVDKLNIDEDKVRVGMVEFGNEANVQFHLNEHYNKQDIINDIKRMPFLDANTNTSGGLYYMMNHMFTAANGDRVSVPNTAIVITDGRSTYDHHLTVPYAMEAKRRGIYILAVGIGSQINEDELRAIASVAKYRTVFRVSDFKDLTTFLTEFMSYDCTTSSTTTTTKTTTPAAATTATSTTTPTTTTTTTTPSPALRKFNLLSVGETMFKAGYYSCEAVDVVLLLDASSNVGWNKFNSFKLLAAKFVNLLNIETGDVQVAVVTFDDKVNIDAQLGRFSTRWELTSVIENLRYTYGRPSNLAAAFQSISTNILRDNGRNVPKFIVLLTDGSSNNQPKETLEQVKAVKTSKGVLVLVVAVGHPDWIDRTQLNAIASHPTTSSVLTLRRLADNHTIAAVARKMHSLTCTDDGCGRNLCGSHSGQCTDVIGNIYCSCYSGYGGAKCTYTCRQPASVVFAVDSSTSVNKHNFDLVVQFLRLLTTQLSAGSQVALLTFTNTTNLFLRFTNTSTYNVLEQLSAVYIPLHSTDTADALQMACSLQESRQHNRSRIVLLIVDGRSNNLENTRLKAAQCWQAGVQLLVIGVGGAVTGDMYAMRELRALSYSVDQDVLDGRPRRMFTVPDFQSISSLMSQVSNVLCYNTQACDRNPCQNGGICRNLIDDDYTCRCPTGLFTGANCQRFGSGHMNVVFAIDVSGSVRNDEFHHIITFVKKVILDLEVATDRTRVGVISWSDVTRVDFQLNRYTQQQEVLSAMDYIVYDAGQTNTSGALRTLRTVMFENVQMSGSKIAVVVTDGNSNIEATETELEAIALHQSGVHVITVAVGSAINNSELSLMATHGSQDNMYNATRYHDILSLVEPINAALINNVDECASNPCQFDGKCVDDLRYYTCQCTEHRSGQNCQHVCWETVDLAIVLDMSGSTDSRHQLELSLARHLVDLMNIQPDAAGTRVALITYGDVATERFNLSTYHSKSEILEAFYIRPENGRTNAQHALTLLQQTFQADSRPEVPNIAVVITDARSNIQPERTLPTADQVRRAGTSLYVIGVDDVNVEEAKGMAGPAYNRYSNEDLYFFRVNSEPEGNNAVDYIASKLCERNQYIPG